MTRRKRILLLMVAVTLVLAGVVVAVSWKVWLENQLKAKLVTYGFPGAQFDITAVGPHSITFSNIVLAEGSPYRLQSLTVDYSPLELLHGNIRSLHAANIVVKQGAMDARLDALQVDAALQPAGGMGGHWRISGVNVNNAPLNLPVLAGEGTFTWNGDVALEGAISNADNAYRASFAFALPADSAKGAQFTLHSAALPWNGGVVSTKDVIVPLAGVNPIDFTLRLQGVALQELLQQALAGRVTASGTVSGTVPITVRRNGTFMLHQGTLSAQNAGTIALSPDSIPGDNVEIAVLREVLKNFHYSNLSMGLDSDPHDKLSILLSLAGNNPDAYNGREVKLNVHLSGDLLDLLQQGLTSVSDPNRFLKEQHDEKK